MKIKAQAYKAQAFGATWALRWRLATTKPPLASAASCRSGVLEERRRIKLVSAC